MNGNVNFSGSKFRDSNTPESPRVRELRRQLDVLTDAVQRKRRFEEFTAALSSKEEQLRRSENPFSYDLIPTEEVEYSDSSQTLTDESEISLRNDHPYEQQDQNEEEPIQNSSNAAPSPPQTTETVETEDALHIQSAASFYEIARPAEIEESSMQSVRMRVQSHPIDPSN